MRPAQPADFRRPLTVQRKSNLPVKLKYGKPRSTTKPLGFGPRLLQGVLIVLLVGLVAGSAIFGYFYYHYQRVVDDRLKAGPIFASVSQIYAAPKEIRDGQNSAPPPSRTTCVTLATTATPNSAPSSFMPTISSSNQARRASTPPTAPPSTRQTARFRASLPKTARPSARTSSNLSSSPPCPKTKTGPSDVW